MKKVLAVVLVLSLLTGIDIIGGAGMDNTVRREDIKEVAVHDPSIIKDNGKYYAFGSHITTAKSDDLINWDYVARGYKATGNVHFGNLSESLEGSFKWAGENDGDCLGGYAVWAPSVYYNEKYVWENGNRGAYMMYYSASSTYKRSCIGLAVSKNIEGPYEYVDTVIYSGFTKNSSSDENSTHNNKYTNTNIDELIEKGRVSGYKEDWGIDDYNNITYPNAIDPCIYEDEKGKLYIAYGSWSGGIFVLPVNELTGLPVYPGFDSTTEDGRMIDRYFGTHIAGGKGWSGEGAFVYYDAKTGYYYLQDTYDWLGTDGGYHIRMFKSQFPTGPFTDIKGNGAVYGDNHADSGVKMFGNYCFDDLERPYTSGGHSSVLLDDDGQKYIVYHTRFKNSDAFRMRVHQMFVNEDGWAVVAPYRYMGTKATVDSYSVEEVVGDYEFINHGTGIGEGTNVNTSVTICLSADGKVKGAIDGDWSVNGKYCTITTADTVYKGVLITQQNEKNENVIAFSAVGSDNSSIWGVKKKAVNAAVEAPTIMIGFDGELKNCHTVTCKSSDNPKADGSITPQFEDGIVGEGLRLDGTMGLEIDNVDLSGEVTVGFWMKADEIKTYTPVVAASADFQDSGFEKWFSLTTFDNGKNAVIWSRNAEHNIWMEKKRENTYRLGQWQYITLVIDPSYYGGDKDAVYCKLYIDGYNIITGSVAAGAFSPQSRLYFGINPWDKPFCGVIDEITIYDKALSDDEVKAVYNSYSV